MNRFALLSSFVCLFGLVACGSTDNSVGAMPGSDGGTINPDVGTGEAGPAPVIKCGTADAFKGNHTQCAAMDAEGQDLSCKCVSGYKWDGAQCTGIGGCNCVGFDCAGVFTTIESCQTAHANCEAPVIKCEEKNLFKGDHTACGAMNAKGQGDCFCAIGFSWDGAACKPITGCECVGVDCKSVFTDEAKCQAAHTACSPVSLCGATNKAPHGSCDAMDVKPSAEMCNCGSKYYWDGSSCVGTAACTCTGTECESVYNDAASCYADHTSCQVVICSIAGPAHTECKAMDVQLSDQSCDCGEKYYWDGAACVGTDRCKCTGKDCPSMYQNKASCETDHVACK